MPKLGIFKDPDARNSELWWKFLLPLIVGLNQVERGAADRAVSQMRPWARVPFSS